MSIVNGISRIGFMKGGGKALWKDENIADSITAHAIDFIKVSILHRKCTQRRTSFAFDGQCYPIA